MDRNPIHLTILRRGDVHIVDLAEVQAIIPRSETRVDGVFLNEIGDEIKRITNLVGPEFRRATQAGDVEAKRNPRVVRDLKNLGSLIFSHLLPQAARDRLRSSESSNLYLRLDDQLVHIPWELAFDGQQFLGMKFRVGRQIITHHKVAQAAAVRAVSDALKVLIVSDPSETLKNVTKECEQLCEILDGIPTLDVRLIGGRGVKRIPLLAALRESDIVHFAGHSQFDEKNPENSGWLLHDGLLSASEISKLDQTPLLVFSNSCQAGATKDWQGEYLFEGQAFGLGSAFLLAGVPNYIGTFCVVHDEESRFLAGEFYKRIVQGKAIGQALLEARLATAEEMGLDRLTWASYMLYGDPALSPLGRASSTDTVPTETDKNVVDVTAVQQRYSEKASKAEPSRASVGKAPPATTSKSPLAWLSGALLAVVTGFLLFMLWGPRKVVIEPPLTKPVPAVGPPVQKPEGVQVATGPKTTEFPSPTKTETEGQTGTQASVAVERPAPGERTRLETPGQTAGVPASPSPPLAQEPPTRPSPSRLSQDLTDIRVELDHLQVTPEQSEVIVYLKFFNKTPKDLAITLGDSSDNFVTESTGSSYRHRGSSGIGRGVYEWTYIPPSAVHTVAMRFHGERLRPQRNSTYSVSAEVILAPRDDVERLGRGRRLDSQRTVNVSIHGIRPD